MGNRSLLQHIRFLAVLLLLLAANAITQAQPYGNEWIDYSKTYYKFKVGADGLFRIPSTTLSAHGLNTIPAEQFRLFRNGKEVPIYTSVATGAIPADGYIEFWGLANDGEIDSELYREPQFQHRKKFNLHSDSSSYFLTIDEAGLNKRFLTRDNIILGNTLPPEPYFMHKLERDFKERLNPGFAADLDQYVYSSAYDKGEFFSSNEIRERITRSETQANLRASATGPEARINFGAFGNTIKTRRVRVSVNGNSIYEEPMNFFSDILGSAAVPLSYLTSGTASIGFTNVQPPPPATGTDPYIDRMVVSFYELIYPRTFNFNNLRQFTFELPSKATGHYLEITNFNTGGVPPILYDLRNNERYVGNIAVSGTIRFALPGTSLDRQLVLVSQQNGFPVSITNLTRRSFVNYSNETLHGDYLIISNARLFGGGNTNPVQQYSDYRRSEAGGGYNSIVYDVDQLVDQFAFGTKGHPASISRFIKFVKANFTTTPKFVLIIGKGVVYSDYKSPITTERARIDELNLVPTFGFPGSDNMLVAANNLDPRMTIPIGRISVIKPSELENYLEKLIEYEEVQRVAPNSVEGRLWMKNVLHVTGATDALLGTQLCSSLATLKEVIKDTLSGSNVTSFCSTVGVPPSQSQSQIVRNLFESGLNLMTYFGHSSASTLEFSVEEPTVYNNEGKYPIFSVNGCYAGDFFRYSEQRFNYVEILTEKYVLAKKKGVIAFLASTHFGVVSYLSTYLNSFYKKIAAGDDELPLGVLFKASIDDMLSRYASNDFLARCHAEQLSIHGDPALTMYHAKKLDYVIEESSVEVLPQFVSLAEETFDVKVKYYNIGKSVNDSINVEVRRVLPDGSVSSVFNAKRKYVNFVDSFYIRVPIIPTTDKGQNQIIVILDGENQIDEVDENNNVVSKNFFIYEDEATPIYPYDFSVINSPVQKFYASTANPFSDQKRYFFELDTTALFNSSLRVTAVATSKGGILEFSPSVTLVDSMVYYWRTAAEQENNVALRWSMASFQYISNSGTGFGQAHLYQHTQSRVEQIHIDSIKRKWRFDSRINNLVVRNGVFPSAADQAREFSVQYNGNTDIASVCGVSGIIFNVFDPITFKPWLNALPGQTPRFGSDNVCGNDRRFNFQFNILNQQKRKSAMEFLRNVPDGYIIVVRNISGTNPASNTYAKDWKADTTLFGSGNSLYHAMAEQGAFADSFAFPRSFILIYRKGRLEDFPVLSKFSEGINDKISISTDIFTEQLLGHIVSPRVGPAKKWDKFIWNAYIEDANFKDSAVFRIIGTDRNGTDTILKIFDTSSESYDLSGISVSDFPYLKMSMTNVDSVYGTPYQLRRWHLLYEPQPEGAIAPNIYFISKDTLDVGEQYSFGIAFKNISNIPFDSVKVKIRVTDASNIVHEILPVRLKPLVEGDTIRFTYVIDTKKFSGLNTLYVAFNPDNDQPEQNFYNNFFYKNFYVKPDRLSPLLEVTFDGLHIVNGDIVSGRPHIQIRLKDEAKYLLLTDTASLRVRVRFPNGTNREYKVDGDTLRFTPATAASGNSALLDFFPSFLHTYNDDGTDTYELLVNGKDVSNNVAGNNDYAVNFVVVNKPMISNLLNYPNPFTTSTAFVFTITGSEIPTNFKIQVLTITGRVVREITALELGPLRIGRNITDFKWDGTDQFGQRLANGVYLYRVVSTLNGKKMDKFTRVGEDTDKYFTRGYGKMYLMR